MAKILYGVQGTGHGHAVRALSIARQFREHEFFFTSYGDGLEVLAAEVPAVEMENPRSPVRGHSLSPLGTLWSLIKNLAQYRAILQQALNLMERFKPDVVISDYEYYLPRAARRLGIPCLSLDHQHIVALGKFSVPLAQYPSYRSMRWSINTLYSVATDYLVISFFQPPLRPGVRATVLPPLLRDSVLARQASHGGHVLAYQGYTTFPRFFDFLKAIPSEVRVYGFNRTDRDANLQFKAKSEGGFLDDLASCRYVVCGASHTLVSEALYYGKPVLCFPIRNAFEQFLNALFVARLGYGQYITGFNPRPDTIPAFEARLGDYRGAIRQAEFCGNPAIFEFVDRFIRQAG
jgi:uncharacterized protein (TIGR00661 family)